MRPLYTSCNGVGLISEKCLVVAELIAEPVYHHTAVNSRAHTHTRTHVCRHRGILNLTYM